MLFGLAALSLLPMALAQRQCFYPNGERDTGGVPCGVDGGASGHTHCCYSGAYCLSNGLCFEKKSLTMYRSSCTDSTFGSDKCGQICLGGNLGGVDYSHSGVWTCGDDRFTCHSASCAINNFTLDGGILQYNDALLTDVTELALSASASGSSSPATTTVTETVRVTSTAGAESIEAGEIGSVEAPSGVSTAAAAGIGAGVGIPLLLLAAALLFLLFRERKKRQAFQNQLQHYGISTKYPPQVDPTSQYQPVDAGGHYHAQHMQQPKPVQPPSELTADPRYELHH
ncbi:hypothetical protein F5X68DRAFT_272879 [Plectosphaerella plurivora]|uniref:Uncharacterized protein n=1 Tax=Plectosphaerella plurivora TaxID=936078 RepID=A0A9P8VN30_9PEZI|nr:hypothetical protein F5X68DRAFT_272879 [Plectosphaerella plurivora]